jgi:hypothetical protein
LNSAGLSATPARDKTALADFAEAAEATRQNILHIIRQLQ